MVIAKYAAIFDMDGVLIDSYNMSWDSFKEILRSHRVKLTDEEIKRDCLGKSLRDNILLWNNRYGLKLELKQVTEESWIMQLKALEKISPDNSLVRLLDDLKTNNTPLAVGTSSQRFRAEKILQSLRLEDYFSGVACAEDVSRHKPSPDIFLESARRINMPPKRCVVFEDAASGIEAARRAGMKSIGYKTYHNTDSDVRNADLAITNFSELNHLAIASLFS
jgi:HAD superfamily hydrolase (TIGR01549 family)